MRKYFGNYARRLVIAYVCFFIKYLTTPIYVYRIFFEIQKKGLLELLKILFQLISCKDNLSLVIDLNLQCFLSYYRGDCGLICDVIIMKSAGQDLHYVLSTKK